MCTDTLSLCFLRVSLESLECLSCLHASAFTCAIFVWEYESVVLVYITPKDRLSPLIACDINTYCCMQLIWMFMTKRSFSAPCCLFSISHLPLQAYTHISAAISVARLQEMAYDLIIGGFFWEKKSQNKPLQCFFFISSTWLRHTLL